MLVLNACHVYLMIFPQFAPCGYGSNKSLNHISLYRATKLVHLS